MAFAFKFPNISFSLNFKPIHLVEWYEDGWEVVLYEEHKTIRTIPLDTMPVQTIMAVCLIVVEIDPN